MTIWRLQIATYTGNTYALSAEARQRTEIVTGRSARVPVEERRFDSIDVQQTEPVRRKQEPGVGDGGDGDGHQPLYEVLAVSGRDNLAAEDLGEGVRLEVQGGRLTRHLGSKEVLLRSEERADCERMTNV